VSTNYASIGVDMIADERRRQTEREGWSPRHDDNHTDAELVSAAICYAEAGSGFDLSIGHKEGTKEPRLWPWESQWWKPSDDLTRNLAKAGALIAAEIDRLAREDSDSGRWLRSGASQPEGWQPIVTAPERRKLIVTWVNALGRRTAMASYWPAGTLDMSDNVAEEHVDEDGKNVEACWVEETEGNEGEVYPLGENLDYWRPLPPAPTGR